MLETRPDVKMSPPSNDEEFYRQLNSPQHVLDPVSKSDYSVYEFNSHSLERPIVIYMGLGSTALNASGQSYLKHHVDQIQDRRFLLIDPDQYAGSLDDTAQADLRILDQLEVEDADVYGMSFGGVQGARLAAHAGTRIKHLITVSTVGTKRGGYLEYARSIPGQMSDSGGQIEPTVSPATIRGRLAAFREVVDFVDIRNPRTIRKLGAAVRMIVQPSLESSAGALSPRTRWTDIVGAKDQLTDYADHLQIVSQRNETAPGSSSLHILSHKGHLWGDDRAELAAAVKQLLERKDPRNSPDTDY